MVRGFCARIGKERERGLETEVGREKDALRDLNVHLTTTEALLALPSFHN